MSSLLLASRDMVGSKGGHPDWLKGVYNAFQGYVVQPEFPCDFGTSAALRGHLRYSYTQAKDLSQLPNTLSDFLRLSRSHPRTRHALVLFEEPEIRELSLEEYRDRFWEILQYLHDKDPMEWPAQTPRAVDDPQWEFSFGGDSMFVFGSSPAYHLRRSRNLGPSLVLLFQPRRVFHGIEGGTTSGIAARERIRRKLRDYDDVADHPDMGAYSDESSYEWKQYFIPDDNQRVAGSCPLRIATDSTRIEPDAKR